ncbi:MAG: EscR/YscR/HrcR family type III secretion system export apparatus protein, partial [Phycisphaerae bacterium]|nr:EscR/YscR/HrcR family type III secretion system export apparatus protein [Phycisphaerae bacterium]
MTRWCVILMIFALAPAVAPAVAQRQGDGEPGATAEPPASRTNVPGVGDVLNVIDKATQPKEDDQAGWTAPVRLAVVFAFLALLPSLLVMMTSFTRIVIVLSFIRRALSTQSIPPTVAIIGLALFLTFFTMTPVFSQINEKAIQPYMNDQLTLPEATEKGNLALKDFMLRQTRADDLELFLDMAGIEAPESQDDVPMHVAIPAFAISEFRTAFEIGCLLFIPFLLIDLVVGGILL